MTTTPAKRRPRGAPRPATKAAPSSAPKGASAVAQRTPAKRQAAASTRPTRKAKAEVAKAQEFVEDATEATVAGTINGVTLEQIVEARVTKGLSWADVAKSLELGGSTRARRTYRLLSGKAPSELKPVTQRRARRGTGGAKEVAAAPDWDSMDQDTIWEMLDGATIEVNRWADDDDPEVLGVATLRQFIESDAGLAIEFVEGYKVRDPKSGQWVLHDGRSTGHTRTIRLSRIRKVVR